ncbi:MAG: DUF6198 family protein [Eubacteriales bacterium]|nr:DUF6198 family protein [Eubacteriales bacterium]
MKKHVFYTEAAYLAGMVLIAMGVVWMEKADFGVSMIVAPAYILYRWINPMWSTFSFGMAEYCLQAVLLAVLALAVGRFKLSYLLSFVTAVLYGFLLDGLMALGAYLPCSAVWQRVLYYALGVTAGSAGVAMMFRTYLPPEAYELFVKELAGRFCWNIHKCKTVYDCISCALGVLMSLLLFGAGNFVGVKWGTILCALINGFVISLFSRCYQTLWTFQDAFSWRTFFDGKPPEAGDTAIKQNA